MGYMFVFTRTVFAMLFTIFQFEFELVEPPDGKYGSMADDGSWDGMILELMKDVSMCIRSGIRDRGSGIGSMDRWELGWNDIRINEGCK